MSDTKQERITRKVEALLSRLEMQQRAKELPQNVAPLPVRPPKSKTRKD